MSPTLGQTVFYLPLASEGTQSFAVASATQPTGEAIAQPTPVYPAGFRAATVIGHGGEHRATLLVYKQPGDPFRGESDALAQRLADVPYSPAGIPGTWMYERDAHSLAKPITENTTARRTN